MKKEDKFIQGYVCAVANIVSSHGPSTEAREALVAAGLTNIKRLRAAGVDEYDIKIIECMVKGLNSC